MNTVPTIQLESNIDDGLLYECLEFVALVGCKDGYGVTNRHSGALNNIYIEMGMMRKGALVEQSTWFR
jgi:hypothetical protein